MADGDQSTKDASSLLFNETTSAGGGKCTGDTGSSNSHRAFDRQPSRKHLTVAFSTGRRVGTGATAVDLADNEFESVTFPSLGPSSNSNEMTNKVNPQDYDSNRARTTNTNRTSAPAAAVSVILKKVPSSGMSYDNFAGPSIGAGGTSHSNDLAKFLRDDSIWKDLKVDFVNGDDDGSVFVSDDLERSTASSVVQGSERSWATSSSVRNRVEKIRNKCSPTWTNIKTFVFVICVLITVHGSLATGYTMSVITTIEKRFEISSKTSGLVVSSYEFGSLLSVIFVSYFGSNGHIPRVVGLGGIVLAAGSLLFSLPHLIAPIYLPSNSSENGGASDTCSPSSAPVNITSIIMEAAKLSDNCADGNEMYILILMFAQVLLGIGGTPLFTLGTTYIDNHVEKEYASVYLAFMYVAMALGPVLGYLLGAVMTSNYVNAKVPKFLTTSSPEWVGLWWGGFIVCGVLYLISSIPFFFFPRRLSNKRANDEDSEYGRSWKKIPISVLRLLTNSVYMVATLNACIELAIVTGFTVFLPKYLETQFRVSTSNASVLTGAVAVPGACVGIFFGGWLMKRLKLELQGVAGLVILVNTTAMIMMSGFFLFGCGTVEIAGVTAPYRSPVSIASTENTYTYNLTDPCNAKCRCSQTELQSKLICGVDGITYMSPCFAGCVLAKPSSRKPVSLVGDFGKTVYDYYKCSCIVQPPSKNADNISTTPMSTPVFSATDGMCDDDCGMLVPFMILVFVLSLAASNNQMPLVMVTLRSVSTQEKAFGLGVQVVILRLLSYIPAPIVYGDVIDNTCVKWNEKCGMSQKNCIVYNIHGFRMRFASLSMGLMVAGVGLSVLLWFCIKRRYAPFSAPVTMSEIAHRFGDFDNLHIVRSQTLRTWVSDDSLLSNRPHTPRHQKTRSC